MAQAVEEWYKQMPIITRTYLTAAIVTTIDCSLEVFLGFSVLGANPWVDLLGMIAGHAYLKMYTQKMTGRRPLIIKSLFEEGPVVAARPAEVHFAAPPVEDAQQN